MTHNDIESIIHDFTYHSPREDQIERYQAIRNRGCEFALFLLLATPKSRAQTHAINKIHEAVFWANAAIARNEESPVE